MVLKFGIEFVPSEKSIDIAYYSKIAEQEGFNNIWVTDHFTNRSVFATLTQVALYTSRIMIGTGVTNYYHIHPAILASSAASISEVSGGRMILGLGAGDKITLGNLGITREAPLKSMRESISIIRKLWTGESISNEGIFTIPSAQMNYRLKYRPPKIYMAAQGPLMCELAAEIADGVLVNASHPSDYDEAKRRFELGLERTQRSRRGFDVCAYTAFSIDKKDSKKAANNAKIVVAFIVAGSAPVVLERHGIPIEEANAIGSSLSKGDFKSAIDGVTDVMLDQFCIYGTPDECIDKIELLTDIGVTQLVCGSPLGKNVPEAIKLIGKTIIPAFLSRW